MLLEVRQIWQDAWDVRGEVTVLLMEGDFFKGHFQNNWGKETLSGGQETADETKLAIHLLTDTERGIFLPNEPKLLKKN